MHVCILLVCLSLPNQGGDTVPLKEIGVTLPRTTANIQYVKRQNFDQQGLGYNVGYANKMCIVSLIVYDANQKGIPDGKANALVEEQLKQSIADMKSAQERGYYSNLKRMQDELPLPKVVKDTFASAGFTFDIKGGGCKSYVLLMGRNQHFLKVRVTQYVVNGQTNDTEVNEFLTMLAKALTKRAK